MMNRVRRVKPMRRHRRGATLVFVALLIVAMLGVSALVFDFSRIYVGVNELQTAADAAALRAAQFLQHAPTSNPTTTVASYVASSNRVMGTAPTQTTVQGWHWDPDTKLRKTAVWGNTGLTTGVNAVSVTLSQPAGLLFGRVLAGVMKTPTRSSVAWVAQLGLPCTKPWMFEISPVYARASITVPSRTAPTAAQHAAFRDAALASNIFFTVAPPTEKDNPPKSKDYGSAVAGKWIGVDLDDGTVSTKYKQAIETCYAGSLSLPTGVVNAADGGSSHGDDCDDDDHNGYDDHHEDDDEYGCGSGGKGSEGSNADVVKEAINAIDYSSSTKPGVCDFSSSKDDKCNASNSIPVLLGYNTSGSFGDDDVSYSARTLVMFRLLCFKRPKSDKCSAAASGAPSSWKDVPDGTMYGYLEVTLPPFTNSVKISNSASTAQRLVVVK